MDMQFSIFLDKKIMGAVYRRIFFRTSRLSFVLLGVSTLWFLWASWECGTPVPIVVWGVAAAIYILWKYMVCMRMAGSYVSKWGEREVAYRATDEALHVSAPEGNIKIPWAVPEKLWRYRDVWLIFIDRVNTYILPADKMAGDLGEFIISKVRENGGKVK